ncbi:hypothetical protein [Bacillus wiedmannii]|nr:hypothetical protein [Bacillus wiedmannii]
MLFKLSRHSMKKMLKDYMVLLIGLVISISIFGSVAKFEKT